jgi:hypothetical protein
LRDEGLRQHHPGGVEQAADDHTVAADAIGERAQARAGSTLLDTWRAGGSNNQAGDLIAGAATLGYSIAYLRDFGQ